MFHPVRLAPGIVIEQLAGDLLVFVPGGEVLRLSGAAADVLLEVQAGQKVDLSHPSVADLLQSGVVVAPGLSRRSFIKAGAIGAGAGVAVVALPTIAAAASPAEAETQLATFVILTATDWVEGTDTFKLGHGVGPPPPRRIDPDPFPTTGTTGTYTVRGLELAMIFDADGNSGLGTWDTVALPTGTNYTTLDTFLNDIDDENAPNAERGSLTWRFGGINFLANHFL